MVTPGRVGSMPSLVLKNPVHPMSEAKSRTSGMGFGFT